MASLVGTALFADGSAAVVAVGERRAEKIGARGPAVLDSCSHLYPDSLRTMGWDVGPTGLKLVLSVDVPDVVARHLPGDVAGSSMPTARRWTISAPGSATRWPEGARGHPRGSRAARRALELTWRSLAEVGNISSSSVLHVLSDTIAKGPAAGPAIMMAMGPGFCSELVLLQWD